MDGQLTKPPSAADNAQTKEKKMSNGIITFLKGCLGGIYFVSGKQ